MKKKTARSSKAKSSPRSNSIFDKHPNLKTLLIVYGVVVVMAFVLLPR